jgi:hypothetical protein
MKTFWDEEQERLKKEARYKRAQDIVGRDYYIPSRIIGKGFNPNTLLPDDILEKAGYIRHYKKDHGWIKSINKGMRFHAYITKNQKHIHVHADVISKGSHRAVKFGVKDEIRRIKTFLPPMPDEPVREEYLSYEGYKKAMELLKPLNMVRLTDDTNNDAGTREGLFESNLCGASLEQKDQVEESISPVDSPLFETEADREVPSSDNI